MEDYTHLKRLLALEANYRLRPEILDRFLADGTVVALDTYEPMIDAGEYDPDIYVVKTGLVRGTYLDRNTEKTAGFALPGTLLISFHCFYGGEPSYYRFEACCATTVVKIPKSSFDQLLAESHEFALWVMSAHQNQLYYNEYKNRMLSGDSKTKLIQLTCNMTGNADLIEAGHAMSKDELTHRNLVKTEIYSRWKDIFKMVPSKVIASYLGITEQHLSKIKREIIRMI